MIEFLCHLPWKQRAIVGQLILLIYAIRLIEWAWFLVIGNNEDSDA